MIHSWKGKITLLSPLSHNSDESVGTDAKFRRIKIQVGDAPQLVPVYSGNAYRGRLRRLAAMDYLERIGIDGTEGNKISDRLYYTLSSGGALQKGSESKGIDVGMKREMREKIQFISLFGTAYVNQVLPGKVQVGIGFPIAVETQHITGEPAEDDQSIWDLVEEIFYTRRDDLEDKETDDVQQMKYTIECVSTGTVLSHEFVLAHPTEIELSCFGAIMRKFDENASLGGKSGVGHGKVKLDYAPEWPDAKLYYDYVDANKGELVKHVRQMEAAL